MKSKRNIKLALITLMLVFSLALMAACSPSGGENAMTSDKVTETQFDEYIDASLAYFDDFSKPIQIVAERKAAGVSQKREYSRATNGIEMAKSTYSGKESVSYHNHKDGMIKEYSKYPDSTEWIFDEYTGDDDFYFIESFGFDSLLEPTKGHFNWFEYKDNVYNLKTACFTDLLEATGGEDLNLKDFKLAFKGGKLSGISTKYIEESITVTATYALTYNNTSITIPQAALDAGPSDTGIGPLSAAQFKQYSENTLNYFEDSSKPLQMVEMVTFGFENYKTEYSRTAAGIEMAKKTEDGDVGYSYRKHEDGRIKEYTIDPGDDEWHFDEYEEDFFNIGEGYQFNTMLSAVMNHYNWFEYKNNAYCLKTAYFENLADVFTKGYADVTDFKLNFTGNKLSGLSLSLAPYNSSNIATGVYTFTYNQASIDIPQAALDAENDITVIIDEPLSATQFNEYIEKTLAYFEVSNKPLQMASETKMTGFGTQKQEYSRAANGIELEKTIASDVVGFSYRKHESGKIKEYVMNLGEDEWLFYEYEEDFYNIGEEYGFNEMLSAFIGHYDWFEYTDSAYCLKAAHYTDFLEAIEGNSDDVTLTEFKLAFKDSKLSAFSMKIAADAITASVSHTFTYNNTSITIPQAALDAASAYPGGGPLPAAKFDEYLNNTLIYFKDSSKPLQMVSEMKISGFDPRKQEYSRATNGIEMMKRTEDGVVGFYSYRKHESGRIKEYTLHSGDDEWSFYEYEEDFFNIGEDYGFNEMLSAIMGHSYWFEYTDNEYNLKVTYFTDFLKAINGEDMILAEVKLAFNDGKLSAISIIYIADSTFVTESCTFTYNNTSIIIPPAALDAEKQTL